MDLRDDNGPPTAEWRLGLLRRALLEIGRRLPRADASPSAAHAFELDPDEVAPSPRFGAARPATSWRLAPLRRAHLGTLRHLPTSSGRPEPDPPLDVLPPATATLLRAVRAVLDKLASQDRAAAPWRARASAPRSTRAGRERPAAPRTPSPRWNRVTCWWCRTPRRPTTRCCRWPAPS